MKIVLMRSLLLLTSLVLAPCSFAQTNLDGLWDATVLYSKAEIPFHFEITHNGDRWTGSFFEGDRKVNPGSGSYAGGKLQLNFEQLNAVLAATLEGETLTGTYRVLRKNGRVYPFHARRAGTNHDGTADANALRISGDWEMKPVGIDASNAKDPQKLLSWNLYLRQSGAEVSGSILRVDGDTGTLTGRWQGDKLVLSHFAGERPVLFEAKLQPDGTLDILMYNSEKYVAARSSDARAKGIAAPVDPAQFSSVKDPTQPFQFRFPDTNGKIVSNTDPEFKNKVVLLAIGGSWCPNCRDEAPFLVDLYNKFHSQGLEIVGLNFEYSGEAATDVPLIQRFIKEFSIPYPVLYAGVTSDVPEKLPQIENFGAFPTTIYLGRDGRVARVHAGFASTATGEAHKELQRDAVELVEHLLNEKTKEQAKR